MTINEAIIYAEEMAATDGNRKRQDNYNQIAEWLKDYKRMLQQESCETQMIDKSNFSQEQYKADLQSAYDCGKASVEPCEDAISRADAVKVTSGYCHPQNIANELAKLPSVTPQPKTGHCKDCKYFEYDSVAKVNGIPLIVAHEICSKWGDGCKTKENGYCFLFEPRESEVEE